MAQSTDISEVDRTYEAMDPKDREVVETYLRTSCATVEDNGGTAIDRALIVVRLVADAVKPYLIAVQREGPPSPVLNDLEHSLEAAWEARQEFLKTPEVSELGEEILTLVTAITKNQYFQDQREAIQARYREQAAHALRVFASAAICDINGDGKVDRNDINVIFGARNTPAVPNDPRDVTKDGMITVEDARICTLQCTNPQCAQF